MQQREFPAVDQQQSDADSFYDLLSKGESIPDSLFRRVCMSQDAHLRTPLHVCSSKGLAIEVGKLLEAGASVDAVDKVGNTALHLAVLHSYPCVSILLEHGANLLHSSCNEKSPLDLLCARTKLLLSSHTKQTPLLAELHQIREILDANSSKGGDDFLKEIQVALSALDITK
ncbi:MAG: hypothetical protein SGCHY_003023 [Lobulomycetales sp.]